MASIRQIRPEPSGISGQSEMVHVRESMDFLLKNISNSHIAITKTVLIVKKYTIKQCEININETVVNSTLTLIIYCLSFCWERDVALW